MFESLVRKFVFCVRLIYEIHTIKLSWATGINLIITWTAKNFLCMQEHVGTTKLFNFFSIVFRNSRWWLKRNEDKHFQLKLYQNMTSETEFSPIFRSLYRHSGGVW